MIFVYMKIYEFILITSIHNSVTQDSFYPSPFPIVTASLSIVEPQQPAYNMYLFIQNTKIIFKLLAHASVN